MGDNRSLIPEEIWQQDLTELPGLDELSCPKGVLAHLEARAACLWQARETIISLNGASAGLAAAMFVLSSRGSTVLVPRNAHRSIIHGLILSGLFPIWYEPFWDDEWGIWGPVLATSAERVFTRCGGELAGVVVVSPTYAGALSNIASIAERCKTHGIPLVVDEAHGAHLLPDSVMPQSALSAGADIVVHSLHKTLTALTQTGLVHLGENSSIDPQSLRGALNLLQTSSPSYILLSSLEQALNELEGQGGQSAVAQLSSYSTCLIDTLKNFPELSVYQPTDKADPAHILVGLRQAEPEILYDFLTKHGIFPEAILGKGVLLMLGLRTTDTDLANLQSCLIQLQSHLNQSLDESAASTGLHTTWRPPEIVQILSPRQALMLPAEMVPAHRAVGQVAAELIAPCPPGVPLIVPGQRVPQEILEFASIQKLKVVMQ